MAFSYEFYADPTLTQPLATTEVHFDRDIDGSPVDKPLYFGNPTAGYQCAADDGGPINFGITDSDPAAGFAATDIVLALTQAGLDTATAGDPLVYNGTILSGVSGALQIWVRFEGTSPTPKNSTDLGLVTNQLRYSAA